MGNPTAWRPSGQVFINRGQPFLASRGWIHARHGDGGWYTVAKLPALLLVQEHICTPEECAMYGVDYSEELHEQTAASPAKEGNPS